MTERRETVSKNLIENVLPTLGTNSKKPNAVVMAISEDFILDALSLYKDKKKGIERESGFVRLELVAVYAEEYEVIPVDLPSELPDHMDDTHPEDSGEQKIMDMTDELDEITNDEGEA